MEVAWRSPELLNRPAFDMMKKRRAWGVDAQKVVQLMMGQLKSDSTSPAGSAEVTLDLLGEPTPLRPVGSDQNCALTEFLTELDPDQPRLPSEWKTCLDLKTGKLTFVNKTTGIISEDDPRKQPLNVAPLMAIHPPSSPPRRAHEFLGSKRSEILREESLQRTSSSSSSGGSPRKLVKKKTEKSQQMLSFSTGTQLWNIQLADTRVSLVKDLSTLAEDHYQERTNLELDLNLTAGVGSPSDPHEQEQSVCTMEMVQRALRRTDQAMDSRKRDSTITATLPGKLSSSPTFSSLTSARSEPQAWSHGSPSTSSSSSTSRSSSRRDGNQAPVVDDFENGKTQLTDSASEAESMKGPAAAASATSGALVMGACTRCLMYIMLDKSNPKCPRCGCDITLDFTAPPYSSAKRQRVEQLDELDLMTK